MKRQFVFLLTLGFIASHGGFSGVESAKATQVAQAQGCTIRVSTASELEKVVDIASHNGQDDVICIQAGTYTINNVLIYNLANRLSECGKKLTIRAEGNVIIQPAQANRIVYIDTKPCSSDRNGDISIQGIIFQNASNEAIHISTKESNISITNNTFRNNKDGRAAYVHTFSGSVNFQNNAFNNNTNGGVYVYTGSGPINFKNNDFSGNAARQGGGAYVETSSGAINLVDNLFNNNNSNTIYSDEGGGGLKVVSSSGPITLTGNTITDNSAGGIGGGAYIYSYRGSVNLVKNTVKGNRSNTGGGVYVETVHHSITLESNIFSNNRGSAGGGAYVKSEYGITTLINNVFNNNNSNNSGGGVYVYAYTKGVIINFANNTFESNKAINHGGGIYIYTNSIFATDRTISINFYNNIFSNNTSNNDGHEIYVQNTSNSSVTIAYNLFTPSTPPIDFSKPHHQKIYVYSLNSYNKGIPAGCSTSDSFGNIQADPMFADTQKGNLRLLASSPAINKGCNTVPIIPSTDKDGNQRILNDIVDMGAYEYGALPASQESKVKPLSQPQPQSQSEKQAQTQSQPQSQNSQQQQYVNPFKESVKEHIKTWENIKDKHFGR